MPVQWRVYTNSEHFLNPGKFLLLIFNKYFHTEHVSSSCGLMPRSHLRQVGSIGPNPGLRGIDVNAAVVRYSLPVASVVAGVQTCV